jgi:hypothetical protein
MSNLGRYLILFPICLGLTVGCAESKISQCDRLIPAIKQTNVAAVSVAKTANHNPQAIVQQGLSVTDKAASQVGAIKLSDSKLKEYQTSLVGLYTTNSHHSRQVLTALATKDRIKGAQVLTEWKNFDFTTKERNLVNGINSYCFSVK